MFPIIFSLLFSSIRQSFRTRVAMQTEILALRHQLLVLHRANKDCRPRLSLADRLLWVWLSQLWSGWRSALVIVKPETVIAWHRKGFRLYWQWKSRHPQGRPCVSPEVIDLIRKMSMANPRWGAPRIHGELLKVGFALPRPQSLSTWCVIGNHPPRRGEPSLLTTRRIWSPLISSWFRRPSFVCSLSS